MLPIILAGVLNTVLPKILESLATSPAQSPTQAAQVAKDLTAKVVEQVKSIPAVSQAGKPILKTKTFWLGLLQAVGGSVVLYISGANVDWSTSGLPLYAVPIVSGLLTILNRFFTSQPIKS